MEEQLIQTEGYNDHFHEHHHGDKYQSNFLTHYIFSTDHKMISAFLIMEYLGIYRRRHVDCFPFAIGFPEADMAWLRPILGKWIAGE